MNARTKANLLMDALVDLVNEVMRPILLDDTYYILQDAIAAFANAKLLRNERDEDLDTQEQG